MSTKSFNIELNLKEGTIISWNDLVKAKEVKEKPPAEQPSDAESSDKEDDAFFKKLLKNAENYSEKKVLAVLMGQKRHVEHQDEYDSQDSFIDDSEDILDQMGVKRPVNDGFFVWHGPVSAIKIGDKM